MHFHKRLALLVMLWLAWPGLLAAQVSLDLRDASLRDFVQIVAQSTGRNFILDERVQGSVTVVAPNQVSPSAIYEIFLNVLELNRLTIVEGAETDRIVPIDLARVWGAILKPASFPSATARSMRSQRSFARFCPPRRCSPPSPNPA